MGVIYVRPNLINGKKYVGQAKDVKTRNGQWENLNRPYAGKVINAARAKYGIEAFGFEILKECGDEELNQWEMYYIEKLNTKVPYGYNMTDGGDSTYEMTDETKAKLSAALKTSEKAKIARARIADALKGKKLSPEHIAKVADSLRGKKRPAEVVAKVAASNRGKKRTEETKKKIADALKGKKRPDIAAALKGRKRPDISAALRGRKQSSETIEKKAAAQSKAVQALNKDGNVIYEFPSAAKAGRQGFNASAIAKCCLGKLKSHKGLIWRYAEK